ncbi:hypothetical protein SNEBB_008667 [Seison nebaliae]|nr:hypothetical protein SNEBB_008667 [Seison nebaliae]
MSYASNIVFIYASNAGKATNELALPIKPQILFDVNGLTFAIIASFFTRNYFSQTFALIYDTLKKYQSFGVFTKKRNYLTFTNLNYGTLTGSSKSFADYATGFKDGSNNYYLGNDFLHDLSNISPLCISMNFVYSIVTTYMKHCGCTFESKREKYRAHIGSIVDKSSIIISTLTNCMRNEEQANGAKFQVKSPRGFWGNCFMPYLQLFAVKHYAKQMIISIDLPIIPN